MGIVKLAMQRSLNKQLTQMVGQKVKVMGWINSVRKHGSIVFADIRDRSGLVQMVGGKDLAELSVEYVVEVEGKVKNRDEKYYNADMETGKIELGVEKVRLISKSRDLPFDVRKPDLDVSLPVMLDFRAASLRNKKVADIFVLQAEIVKAFREYMWSKDFTEFQAPTMVATATEGGSQVFSVDYFDYKVYLAQSPQFYKQIMVSVFERVFTLAHAYRAEPSVTTRHLTEYTGMDVEMGFIDSWMDVLLMADGLVKHIFKTIATNCKKILAEYGVVIPKTVKDTPVIKLAEAQQIIFDRTGRDGRGESDLDPEGEREICRWAEEEKQSEIVFISHFPTNKRPWYTYPDPDKPDETLSFDLIGKGVEWITGGQRINDYDQLVKNIKKMGVNPADFEIPYLQVFKYGMPAEGGFCIGLERMTQNILEMENVRQATLYPRDMERVDVRLASINPAKNERKEKK